MEPLYFHDSIQIKAPISKVWEVLTKPEYMEAWFDLAADYSSMKGEPLKLGSEILWKNDEHKVYVKGEVIELEKEKLLTTSLYDEAWKIKLAPEEVAYSYTLTENKEGTLLELKFGDFTKVPEGEKIYQDFVGAPKNTEFEKIKMLAEGLTKLEAEGYTELRVCPLPPKVDTGEHTHEVQTSHIILTGELKIKDISGVKYFKPGDFVEFPVGTTHKAKGLTEKGMIKFVVY